MIEFVYPHTHLVAGVDEVGRGPLVGAVVTAAVILDPARPIAGLNDSKKLSEKTPSGALRRDQRESVELESGPRGTPRNRRAEYFTRDHAGDAARRRGAAYCARICVD